jgi:hypothetical protein
LDANRQFSDIHKAESSRMNPEKQVAAQPRARLTRRRLYDRLQQDSVNV